MLLLLLVSASPRAVQWRGGGEGCFQALPVCGMGLRGVQGAPAARGKAALLGMLHPRVPRISRRRGGAGCVRQGAAAPHAAARTLACPCRDRLGRALPVRGLAWARRQPRPAPNRHMAAVPEDHVCTQSTRPRTGRGAAAAHTYPQTCPRTRVPRWCQGWLHRRCPASLVPGLGSHRTLPVLLP